MYLPYWDNLDSLTPLQNEWLKKYARPNAMVIMPQWAMNQPKGFKLDYLLKHVLENGWDLTEAGWAKAHAMGILQGMELTEEVKDEGLKHSKAADLLYKANFEEKSLSSCKAMITRKVASGQLKSNGKSGRELRIDPGSLLSLIERYKKSDDDEEPDHE
jgi:hypothetical protein